MENLPNSPRPVVCPMCFKSNKPGSIACSKCSADFTDPELLRLTEVIQEVGRLQQEQFDLRAKLKEKFRHRKRGVPSGRVETPPSHTPVASAGAASKSAIPTPEISERNTQNALLVIGGSLLAVAIVVFLAITWPSLSSAAQAVVLLAITTFAMSASQFVKRRGLMATAESVSVLSALLLVGDAYGVRHSLITTGNASSYWAFALAATAAILYLYGRFTHLRAPHYLMAVMVQVPCVLWLASLNLDDKYSLSAFEVLTSLTAMANLLVFMRIRNKHFLDQTFAATSAVWFLGSLWLFAGLIANNSREQLVEWQDAVLLAASLISIAGFIFIAPIKEEKKLLVGAWAALLYGYFAWLIVSEIESAWQLSAIIAVGIVFVLSSHYLHAMWRLGTLGAAALALVILGAIAAGPSAEALAKPFRWPDRIWQGDSSLSARENLIPSECAPVTQYRTSYGGYRNRLGDNIPRDCENRPVVSHWNHDWHSLISIALATVSIALLLLMFSTRSRTFLARALNVGVLLTLVVVPLVLDASYKFALLWYCLLAVAQCGYLFRSKLGREPVGYGLLAALVLSATNFAVVAAETTIAVWSLFAAGSLFAAAFVFLRKLDNALAVSGSISIGFVYASLNAYFIYHDFDKWQIALALETICGLFSFVTLVFSKQQLRQAFGLTICTSAVLGLFSIRYIDSSVTHFEYWLIFTAILAVHAVVLKNLTVGAAGATTALISSYAWFSHADFNLVEAYTLPGAMIMGLWGWIVARNQESASSWSRYGAALAVAVLPMVNQLSGEVSVFRIGFSAAFAMGILLWGGQRRLRAQFVFGIVLAGAVTLRILEPLAQSVPRWLAIGVPGLVLFIAGAFWEATRKRIDVAKGYYETLK